MATAESQNAWVVRELMRLMSAGEFDQVYQYIDDDIVLECPNQAFHQGPMFRGIERYRTGTDLVPQIFSSLRLTIQDLYDCPVQDTVVFEQTSEGVIAANGKPYNNRYLMILKFRAGKVVLWREIFDPVRMTDQMVTLL